MHNKRTSKRSNKGGGCGCNAAKSDVQTTSSPSLSLFKGGSGFSNAATFDSKNSNIIPSYSRNSFENDPSNKPHIMSSRSNMIGGKRRKSYSKYKNASRRSFQKINAGKKRI